MIEFMGGFITGLILFFIVDIIVLRITRLYRVAQKRRK